MRALMLFAAVMVTSMSAQASELWFHLRVEEHRGKEVKVEVNLPFSAVERSIALIPTRYIKETSIRIDNRKLSIEELRDALHALKSSPQGQWIAVGEDQESVTMRRDGADVTIRVDDEWDDEFFQMRVPADVFTALVSGSSHRFDFARAIQLLGRRGSGSIVITNGDDKIVRVWVDSSNDGDSAVKVAR